METKKLTSAAANKLIKKLEDQKEYLLSMEENNSTYIMTEGESVVTPDYDYQKTAEEISKLDEQVRRLKHAINQFNCTTVLPEIGKTIDEVLVEMAQLNRRKFTLDMMRKRPEKERLVGNHARNNGIDYLVVNYDQKQVCDDYDKITERIMELQMALDICNQTQVFEVEW